MEIDILILILDILGSAGLGIYFADNIKDDLEKISKVSAVVPVLLFTFKLISSAINMDPKFADELNIQIITIFIGYIFSIISSAITSQFGEYIKDLF